MVAVYATNGIMSRGAEIFVFVWRTTYFGVVVPVAQTAGEWGNRGGLFASYFYAWRGLGMALGLSGHNQAAMAAQHGIALLYG